jgi:hypothetical protein
MDRGNKALADLVDCLTPDTPTTFSLALLRKDCSGSLGTNFKGFPKKNGDARGVPARNGAASVPTTYPHGNVEAEARALIPACPCSTSKSCDCGPVLKIQKPIVKPRDVLIDVLGPQPAKNCRTDNICRDIRSGCVNQNQVSAAQLFACSKAGWAGSWGVYGPVINGPYLGDVNLNPNPPGPNDTFGNRFGLSGLPADLGQSSVFWGGLALGIFTLWYIGKHKR